MEHIISFLDDLGVHRGDHDVKLKEFLKSLIGRAFTWYTKLRSNSINSCEQIVIEFGNKFPEEESVMHIMDLGRLKQRPGEGLLPFIKKYRDRAL